MNRILRPLLLLSLVLLIPIVPFLLFGPTMESLSQDWLAAQQHPVAACSTVVFLLSTDIFLPIPSSVISTWGGSQLGWWLGTLASWLGMTLGAVLGFWLARRWGAPFAVWLSRPEDLERVERHSERLGPAVLVLTRGVPVMAEASVLLLGMNRLSWKRFLPWVSLSNLGVAFGYSAMGEFAARHEWFSLALGVAIVVPVALALIVRQWFQSSEMNAYQKENCG